ncbi:MAG: pyrimidine-nucleoside phosphorylase, partial [Kiritimatiellae bacterium]|nr:pyrimidine-nucleoside phosphorylase [Kiritimatiellia bacterium]
LCESFEAAEALAQETLDSGKAMETFLAMCQAQGGDLTKPLPTAELQVPILAESDGVIQSVDAERIGKAALTLGAGRVAVTETPDLAAGINELLQQGETVTKGQPLCVLHANDADRLAAATALVKEAITLSTEACAPRHLIYEVLSA